MAQEISWARRSDGDNRVRLDLTSGGKIGFSGCWRKSDIDEKYLC
jgi:hypothetical protein